MTKSSPERYRKYWRVNNRIIGALLVVWGLVSLGGGVLFVKQLNAFHFFGLPLGFWIAQQGAIYVFVLIVFVYARVMDAVDQRYKVDK